MSIGRLPDREQRILEEMERTLRRDRSLQRRLRRLSRSGPHGRLARSDRRPPPSLLLFSTPRPWAVALLLAVSVGLMVSGITTGEPGVIWAFAAVWPLTLYAAFRLLSRWTKR